MRRSKVAPAGGARNGLAARYFYLSYPRPRPLPPVRGVDVSQPPDEWVREFYWDLAAAVREHARSPSPTRPGYLDDGTAHGADATRAVTEALAAAETFVPLLSSAYIRRSWPGQEWASFEQRVLAAGAVDPYQRFVPVLWSPLPSAERGRGSTEALSLAPATAAGPYAENGLCALLRLARYREAYLGVVGSLAARIVALAERAPLGPSPAPDPGDCDSVFAPEPKGRAFVLAMATPAPGTRATALPAGAAEYARAAAEQLGFAVVLSELEKSAELLRRLPGTILIDPLCTAEAPMRETFRAFLSELPSWALPVLVTDPDDPLAASVMRTCVEEAYKAYKSYPDVVRRGIRGVSSLWELITLMPFVVSQAEREYLRHGPIQRSAARPAFRPRQTGGAPAPAPVKEQPHA